MKAKLKSVAVFGAALALTCGFSPRVAFATTDAKWTSTAGGALLDGNNYDADPSASDARLNFRIAVSGDITLAASATGAPDGFRIGYDTATGLDIPFLFQNGVAFETAGVFYIYGGNTMTLKGGTFRASNATQAIGASSGSAALVLDGATVCYENANTKNLRLGYQGGNCRVEVLNGATLTSGVTTGENGAHGNTVRVAGSGSTISGTIQFGDSDSLSNDNIVRIENGGTLSGDVKTAIAGTSGNSIRIEGEGSSWVRSAGTLLIDSAKDAAAQEVVVGRGATLSMSSDIHIGNATSGNALRIAGGRLSAPSAKCDIGFDGVNARSNRVEITDGGSASLSRIVMRMGPSGYLNVENATLTIGDVVTVGHEATYESASNCVMRLAGTNTTVSVSNKFTLSKSAVLNVEVSATNATAMLAASVMALETGSVINISAGPDANPFPAGGVCTILAAGSDIDFSKTTINLAPNIKRVGGGDARALKVRVFDENSGMALIMR